VGAGAAEGAVDAANILKPALARGKFRCIGATTIDEYRKYIERDPALERRFQPVHVDEPSVGVTIDILRGLRSKFEQHHTLSYHDKAVEQAAILADKFIADRFLPDKAIDVLDEAGSRVRLENRRLPLGMKRLLKELQDTLRDKEESIKEHDFDIAKQLVDHEMEVRTHITIMKQAALTNEALGLTRKEVDTVVENDVAEVIAGWTGVPVTKISDSESKRLLKMEDTLHERLIGQHHAIVAVSKAIRRARVGLRNPDRPIASFIFAGPTGVGKTELTKALSEYMFSSEDSMIRLDMSEYMEKHTVAKLIGSPPGYVGYNEGGQLTEAVRTKPYSVVLFDEVEKAHPDVFNLLLQILDDGRLSDSKGRVIDFKNTLIIMTTNLGSKIIERESGIKPKLKQNKPAFKIDEDGCVGWEPTPEPIKDSSVFEKVTELVNDELKEFFRPEFLNRIDEIIVFNHLTKYDIWEICGLMINQLEKRLREKDITLEIDVAVRSLLTEEGYDPVYGARPLRRAVMRLLEDTLAQQCLTTPLYPKTRLIVKRNKRDGSLVDYTNDVQVEIDYSDVDPELLNLSENSLETNELTNLSSEKP
jgi:ATP-dependent Clp protease ATP-binding subunit ClpC